MTTRELKTRELKQKRDTLLYTEQVMSDRLRDAIAERDAVLDGPHPEDHDEANALVWHTANAHESAKDDLAAAQRALEALLSGVAE
jgi:hypothetical protein